LGAGAFGKVYHAIELNLLRPTAIKVFKSAISEQWLQWFREEGRIVAGLRHDSIVRVYMSGLTDDDRWYIAYEYIKGCDLSKLNRERRLPFSEIAALLASVSAALHNAHEKGLVHRDVKPANILVDLAGKPFVTDFGLAIRASTVQELGVMAGTPAYMSPEQWQGMPVDRRTDIWSIGIILYEMLIGRRPFGGSTVAELRRSIVEDTPPLLCQSDDTIPPEFEAICIRCLAKEPEERFQTCAELAEKLFEVRRRTR
jgi:serine/threonine protein kinase